MLKIFMPALVAATALAAPLTAQTAEDPAFTAKLRASLLAHPDIIQSALQASQQAAQAQQQQDLAKKVGPLRAELFARKAIGPVLGNPNGTVTVVEYLDYACPFCKQAHTSVDDIVSKRSDVRVVVAQRPILGPDSETLSRFALAADLQGKFRQTHDALYDKFGDDHHTKVTDEALKEVAAKAGLNYDQARRDMTGAKVTAVLDNEKRLADAIGISGTPFFITSDAVYPGAAPEEVMDKAFH